MKNRRRADRPAEGKLKRAASSVKRERVWKPISVLFFPYAVASFLVWTFVGEPLLLGEPQSLVAWRMDSPVVAPGEPLVISSALDTKRNCKLSLARTVQGDSFLHSLPLVSGTLRDLGLAEDTSVVVIPAFPPGTYTFKATAKYTCWNRVGHEYVQNRVPLKFEVVDALQPSDLTMGAPVFRAPYYTQQVAAP